MTNLFKCLTCNETITGEETRTHKCDPRITKYETIEATSYFTAKNDENKECVIIDALNGIGYTFVIKEPHLIPLDLSCDDANRQLTERNTNRQGNNTKISEILNRR